MKSLYDRSEKVGPGNRLDKRTEIENICLAKLCFWQGVVTPCPNSICYFKFVSMMCKSLTFNNVMPIYFVGVRKF